MKKEQIQECCYDLGKQPYEIPDSYGEDIVGKEYYTAKEKRPREVMLEITSFRGICGGAVHYYGTLKAYRPNIHKEGSNYCHSGYLGDDTPLFKDLNIVIELWRYITEEEYKTDPHRYNENMKVTNGWYEKAPIVKFAKEVFKKRFKGDWKLIIKDYTK